MNDLPPAAAVPGKLLSPVLTGLAGRCPRCGRGPLFSGFYRVARSCTACDLDFSKTDVGDGAVSFIVLIVGALGVGLGVWMQFAFETPFWVQIVVTFPVMTALTLGLIRPCKGILAALQYRYDASDSGSKAADGED